MQAIIRYFETVPDFHRILFFTCITFCIWNIENLIPLKKDYHRWRHALYNTLFLAIVLPVQYLMGFLVNSSLRFTSQHHTGILGFSWFGAHPWITFHAGFLLLDLGEYIYHYMMHRTRALWPFHAVHHMEEEVDVSTTLREHPAETFIRIGLTVIWILLTGIPAWALFLRQFIQIASNLLSHSNFRFSRRVNNILALVFITPNLHHVHHHFEQPYTDKNFGDVLSIWDRLFGTFYNGKLVIQYGVDSFQDQEKRGAFGYLFMMPFKKGLVATVSLLALMIAALFISLQLFT